SPHHAVTVFARHSDVGYDHIGTLLARSLGNQRVGFRGGTDSNYVRAVLRKHRLKQLARIILVINYQRAHATELTRTSDCRRRVFIFPELRDDGADRKRDYKSRALAFARAHCLNRSAMQLDQVFNERQSETKPAVPPGARCVSLSEAVKDIWQEIRANAFARVAHGDANVWVHAFQARFDAASLRCELYRVGKQVPDYLLQAEGVAG